MKLQQVALKEIKGPLCQIRWHETQSDPSLVNSILENGLVRPLLLVEEEGEYEVVLGTRRFKALQALEDHRPRALPPGMAWIGQEGEVQMLALIAEEMTVAQGLLLSFIDNETGRDLFPYEQAQCFQTMVNDLGYSPEQVAEKLGRTLSEVSWGLGALGHLSSAALDAWQEGRLSTSHVKELMRVEDDSLRGALLDRTLQQDLSVARLAFLVDQARQLDQVPALERPLFELRDKLQQNSWISLRMQAGQIGVEDSRKGDRLSLSYSSPEELLELLRKLIDALS